MNTTLIFAIAIFALGVVSGLVVIVCIGIHREERDFRRTGLVSITRLAPGRVSDGTRALTGLFTRGCKRGLNHPPPTPLPRGR